MRDALAKKDVAATAAEALPEGAIGQVSQRLAKAFERLEIALKNKSETYQKDIAALKQTGGELEAKHAKEIASLKQQDGEKEKQLRALVAESAKEVEKSIRSIDAVLEG